MANRQTRKQEQTKKRRLKFLLMSAILIVLAGGGVGTWFLVTQLNTQAPTIQQPAQSEIIVTPKIESTQAAAKVQQNTGDYQDLTLLTADAVAQIFTYTPLISDTQYHATTYVLPDKRQEYLEFLKTTLYFYYTDLVQLYGETELPKVAEIMIGEAYESDFFDEGTQEAQIAYEIEATWNYENNKSTLDESQQWSNTGTFTWIYNESENQWYLVDFEASYDELAVVEEAPITEE